MPALSCLLFGEADAFRPFGHGQSLYITINSLAKGSSAASFNVASASPAIELIHTACHT
jgi:hypothetical protein